MTKTDTIGRVSRPRGVLTDEQMSQTNFLRQMLDSYQDEWRDWVVGLLAGGCSFNEVSRATGLSKDTLQRWKKESAQ